MAMATVPLTVFRSIRSVVFLTWLHDLEVSGWRAAFCYLHMNEVWPMEESNTGGAEVWCRSKTLDLWFH